MKAVITVIGKDMVGILAKVSTACAKSNVNVVEVTQSILDKYFAMIMLVDIQHMECSLDELKESILQEVPTMTVHAVSYTHLDVYKRQVIYNLLPCIWCRTNRIIRNRIFG